MHNMSKSSFYVPLKTFKTLLVVSINEFFVHAVIRNTHDCYYALKD